MLNVHWYWKLSLKKKQLHPARQKSTSYRQNLRVRDSALVLKELHLLKPLKLHRFTVMKETFSLTASAAQGFTTLWTLTLNLIIEVGWSWAHRCHRWSRGDDSCEGRNLGAALLLFGMPFSAPLQRAVELKGFLVSPQKL